MQTRRANAWRSQKAKTKSFEDDQTRDDFASQLEITNLIEAVDWPRFA
jgi:hypothetical protein